MAVVVGALAVGAVYELYEHHQPKPTYDSDAYDRSLWIQPAPVRAVLCLTWRALVLQAVGSSSSSSSSSGGGGGGWLCFFVVSGATRDPAGSYAWHTWTRATCFLIYYLVLSTLTHSCG